MTARLAPGKYPWPMFSPQGPSVRELAMQALSSVEGGYDLLAPKFDHTPFRTPDGVLDATAGALRPLGPLRRIAGQDCVLAQEVAPQLSRLSPAYLDPRVTRPSGIPPRPRESARV
jgi:hypothetical protein